MEYAPHIQYRKKIIGEFNLVTVDTVINPVDSFPIGVPTNNPITVQSKLNRFSLQLEYKITRDVTLSGGATLNILNTAYFSNGIPARFNDFPGSTATDPDNEFRSIKPPYLIGNSYDGNNSNNTRMWVGIQLSLFYRIPLFARD